MKPCNRERINARRRERYATEPGYAERHREQSNRSRIKNHSHDLERKRQQRKRMMSDEASHLHHLEQKTKRRNWRRLHNPKYKQQEADRSRKQYISNQILRDAAKELGIKATLRDASAIRQLMRKTE